MNVDFTPEELLALYDTLKMYDDSDCTCDWDENAAPRSDVAKKSAFLKVKQLVLACVNDRQRNFTVNNLKRWESAQREKLHVSDNMNSACETSFDVSLDEL